MCAEIRPNAGAVFRWCERLLLLRHNGQIQWKEVIRLMSRHEMGKRYRRGNGARKMGWSWVNWLKSDPLNGLNCFGDGIPLLPQVPRWKPKLLHLGSVRGVTKHKADFWLQAMDGMVIRGCKESVPLYQWC